jgi:hypothetical protein
MPSYIFLDTWALIDFTKPDRAPLLAGFPARRHYTVILTSSLLTELYNSEWQGRGEKERVARIITFLNTQHCVIVDPFHIWRAEFEMYPRLLAAPRLELDLDAIPGVPRGEALLRFMRRDQVFLDMGKDIAAWAASYERLKRDWPTDMKGILQNACDHEYLHRDRRGRYANVGDDKALFLASLDMRTYHDLRPAHLRTVPGDFESLAIGSPRLRGVRLTSLAFWYKYVEVGVGRTAQVRGSDIGDIYHATLMPYCDVFTVDGKMEHVIKQATSETSGLCRILTHGTLDAAIRVGEGSP